MLRSPLLRLAFVRVPAPMLRRLGWNTSLVMPRVLSIAKVLNGETTRSFTVTYARMSTIEERIKKIIAEQFKVELEKVTNSASFVDLGADSLETKMLVMALEEEFDMQIRDEEAEKIVNVQAAIDCINRQD